MNEQPLRSLLLTKEGVRARFLAALLFLLPATSFAENPCANGGSPVPVAVERGPGDEGGVGGTGIDKEGGVGGTGIANYDAEGGIGGTGVEPDTAIIGTVTGFASICVGGTEIHFDVDTPVRLDGVAATAGELAVGQVVQVIAAGNGDRVEALSIDVDHVIAGPVTAVDAAHDRIEVMGQPVLLSEAIGAAGEVGQWVRVSGLRRGDDVVVASRVDVGDESTARVAGLLQMTEPGRAHIGAVPVRLGGETGIDAPATAIAVGHWVNGELIAERVEADRITALRHRVQRVQVEGYVESGPAREIEVGGWRVEVPDGERASWTDIAPDKRVQIKARVDRDGCLVPDAFRFTDPRRPPERPPAPESSGSQGPGAGINGPPEGMSDHSHGPPGGPSRAGPPRGPDANGRPPRLSRPPKPERPRPPDLPRVQRRPPPPRGPRPPHPPGR